MPIAILLFNNEFSHSMLRFLANIGEL